MAPSPTRLEVEPGLQRLWAPWRAAYVGRRRRDSGCIFCIGRLSPHALKRKHLLYNGAKALVMLNRFPYSNGHLLIAPRRHRASPELLTSQERAALADLLARCLTILKKALKPDGFNLGMNLGRIAGAGIPGHMHWHIVPRWAGDMNFMPVVGSTRVISQHLDANFELLKPLFKQLEPALS